MAGELSIEISSILAKKSRLILLVHNPLELQDIYSIVISNGLTIWGTIIEKGKREGYFLQEIWP